MPRPKKTETKPRAKAAKAAPKKPERTFLRNLRYVHVACRVSKERRLELRPRGERGDMAGVTSAELADSRVQMNLGTLFEVVPESEALKVWDAQLTGQQTAHPAWDVLRNERGEEFSNENIVLQEQEFNAQGIKVAELKDGQMIIDRGLGPRRMAAPGSEDNPAPEIPYHVPPEEAADWLARNKRTEGPQAGLGGFSVSVDGPQKGNE